MRPSLVLAEAERACVARGAQDGGVGADDETGGDAGLVEARRGGRAGGLQGEVGALGGASAVAKAGFGRREGFDGTTATVRTR
ncbi:MAG: hypothetical protein U0841_06425 [Chloroflexia bacterium]